MLLNMTDLFAPPTPAVVPALVGGPLQALIAILPGIIAALFGLIVSLLKPRVMFQGLLLCWRLKLPLLAAAFVVVGIGWSASALLGPGAPAEAEVGGTDWPLFRGNIERTGVVPGTPSPTGGGIHWSFRGNNEGFLASPAVVGNRVYISTVRPGFRPSGMIYCLDADTGAVVWRAAPPGFRPTFSSPSISGNRLVIGEGLHDTSDARVICMDLTPGREGTVLWTYTTSSHVESTPVIAEGRVYAAAGDDGIYCFDLEPDADGQAQLIWHLPGEDYIDAETSLAVHNGLVIVGLGIDGHAICLIDAETGEELHRIPTPWPVFGPPAVAHGRAYIGSGTGDYVRTAEEARALILSRLRDQGADEATIEQARQTFAPAGAVWAVDLETFEVVWKHAVPRTILGAVAVQGDELYAGSRDGHLYAISRDGRRLGSFNAHAPIVASPAVTDTHVYAVTIDGMLYALDRFTLEPVWELRISSGPLCVSSPAVARGRIFVGTEQDGLICAGAPAERDRIAVWPGMLGGPGLAGNADQSFLPSLGQFQWQFPADRMGEENKPVFSRAPVAYSGTQVVISAADPEAGGLILLEADASSDQTPQPSAVFRTGLPVMQSAAIRDRTAWVIDGEAGEPDRHLYVVDLDSMTERRRIPVSEEVRGMVRTDDDGVLLQIRPGVLERQTPDGQSVWEAEVGQIAHLPALTPSMVVVATVEPAMIHALDRQTGVLLMSRPLDHQPTTSPIVRRSRVWIGTEGGLAALSMVDGADIWDDWGRNIDSEIRHRPVTAEPAIFGSRLAWVTEGGRLFLADVDTGRLILQQEGAVEFMSPLLSRTDLLFAAKDSIMLLSPADAETQAVRWLETDWFGPAVAPMVLIDSRIYLPTAGWGVVRLGAER